MRKIFRKIFELVLKINNVEDLNKIYEKGFKDLSKEDREKLLRNLRYELDKTDRKLTKLLHKRIIKSIIIGKIKKSLGLPFYSADRENQINKNISRHFKEPVERESLLRIYERIIDESRNIQKKEIKIKKLHRIINSSRRIPLRDIITKKEFLVVLAFFIILLILFYYSFYSSNHYSAVAPVKFEIKSGEDFNEVTDKLYDEGIIPSKTNFKIAAFIYGAEKKIRAARYFIPNDLSYVNLLDLFIDGPAEFIKKIYIRPGLTIKWMAWKLKTDVGVDSAKFTNLCRDTSLINSFGLNQTTMQGYLFPNEYNFYQNSSAKEVIDTMYSTFKKFWVDSLKARTKELGYSIHQILTIASIIKGETNDSIEMPRIAGVYYNRLKRGMKLQADPTVQYLQPEGWKKLNYNDLTIDSPYNTYLYAGLPPGPINNPGKNAILAALYPEKNNYLYFVASGEGSHNFAKTYGQHLRNVRAYKRWIRSQRKK
jgi:peptidoglycan lytic transglycosylase G